jgi:hypothetical protein
MVSRTCILWLGLLALLPIAQARADVQMSGNGPVAFLQSSRLEPGDEENFAQFLASPAAARLRIIYLDGRGGATRAAIAIGRMIRARGIDTAYHVGHGRCVSACTTMFLGGVHRYYIGGAQVDNGVATRVGLGFHPSNGGPAGEQQIIAYYAEMGVPHAADLRYRIYSREEADSEGGAAEGGSPFRLFFVSGNLALQTGVATSVEEPEQPSLRDEP